MTNTHISLAEHERLIHSSFNWEKWKKNIDASSS